MSFEPVTAPGLRIAKQIAIAVGGVVVVADPFHPRGRELVRALAPTAPTQRGTFVHIVAPLERVLELGLRPSDAEVPEGWVRIFHVVTLLDGTSLEREDIHLAQASAAGVGDA